MTVALGASEPANARRLAEIVTNCRPVVLRKLVSGWPAVQAAAASPTALRDHLARFARAIPVEAFIGEPHIAGRFFYGAALQGFNFERRTMPFPEAVDAIANASGDPNGPSIYVGSVPTEACVPGFAAENVFPLLPPAAVGPRIWLGTASNVSCHYDTLDNFACVVAGRRTFTLYPPDAIGSLYVGPIDNTMAGQPVSLAASAAPGEGPFPDFEAVRDRAVVLELEAGDVLYMPKLWWHRVEATASFNALVNYWWDATSSGPDAPYASLLLAMIAIAERPEGERRAWRAFFDHYVFRPEGHPLRHLPVDQHGLLGPLRLGNYGRIRTRIMQMLRGG